MKKNFFILFFALFSALAGLAQPKKKTAEVGVFLGGSYYIGDLNPFGHFNQFTKPAGGIVFRYNFNQRLAARANLFVGGMEGDDSFSNSQAQQQRNLRFRSSLAELSAQLEFNFLDFLIGDDTKGFSPYLFGGIAGFKFNPKAKIDDHWVELQPLGTEGQGLAGAESKRKYKLTQLSLPFGVGVKANLSQNIGISIEWGVRKTFTDYLDDVSNRYYNPATLAARRGAMTAKLSDRSIGTDLNYSNAGRQRGNPTTKDWYSFAGIVLTVKFKDKVKTCPSAFK